MDVRDFCKDVQNLISGSKYNKHHNNQNTQLNTIGAPQLRDLSMVHSTLSSSVNSNLGQPRLCFCEKTFKK